MLQNHRHLREIDYSLTVVGRLATGTECRGKSIHSPHIQHQKVLHSSCCGWQHNYYCQQRQAGWANDESTSLRCLCPEPTPRHHHVVAYDKCHQVICPDRLYTVRIQSSDNFAFTYKCKMSRKDVKRDREWPIFNTSVTRFGEVSPLLRNFISLWQFFKD